MRRQAASPGHPRTHDEQMIKGVNKKVSLLFKSAAC